ncbi:hypothetical protein GBF38_014787 [Nibea albiflora]|uniref:Uncharacterized protein n=1 Tax=Nibea albiflora TaxID=240163 RepID=A0ACB7EJV6_NIBAL|nr:hypothetical protein GBF38_014787 [Nibea albiflora]
MEYAYSPLSTSNQQSSVRSKLPTQFPSSPTRQLQFHTPVRQPTDAGPDPQFTPGPPTLSPYTDPRTSPAQVSISPTPVTPSATLPMFQPTVQTTMIPALLPQTSVHRPPTVSLSPQGLPYPNFPEAQGTQHHTMNQPAVSPYPTPVYQPSPQAPMLSFPAPQMTPQGTDYGQIPPVAQVTSSCTLLSDPSAIICHQCMGP